MKKHISKNGEGKITSKVTKPKDWAFRTPSEGRPKSVHSRRCKPIPMKHVFYTWPAVRRFLIDQKVGHRHGTWDVSCENPARKISAQDVLDVYHYANFGTFEVKFNEEKEIMIFVDLTDCLSGGHDEKMQEAAIASERLDKELKKERNKKK